MVCYGNVFSMRHIYGTLFDNTGPQGGGGGTLIFSYIGSGHFFGVQNFEFQYFFGFSEK